MIDDLTAQKYIREANTINDPAEATRRADALQEWQDEKNANYTRTLYKDLDTLGGVWNSQMQAMHAPFQSNPQQDRAAWANTRFLAQAAGISVDQAAKAYVPLRTKYAQDNFKGEPQDDLSFYNAVKSQYDKGDAVAAIQRDMAEHATASAFKDAMSGVAPDWGAHSASWKTFGAESKSGFSDFIGSGSNNPLADVGSSPGDLAYGSAYMKAFNLMSDHPELGNMLSSISKASGRSDLAQPGLYDPNASRSDVVKRAAQTLAQLPKESRDEFIQMLPAWAKANGEKDPAGFVANVADVFKKTGDAMGRGVESSWGAGRSMANADVFNETLLKDLQSGVPVRISGDTVDLKHAASQGQADRLDAMQGVNPGMPNESTPFDQMGRLATPDERKELLDQAKQQQAYYKAYRDLDFAAKNQIAPLGKSMIGRAYYGIAEGLPVMASSIVARNPAVGFYVMADAMQPGEYNRIRQEYPEMSADSAIAVSSLSASAMAGVGQLRIAAMNGALPILSRIPAVARALSDAATPTSEFWMPLLKRTAAQTGEQWLEQNFMNTAPALAQQSLSYIPHAAQSLFGQRVLEGLGADVPDVDWIKTLGDSIKSPETLLAALPFALVGAGVGTWKESRTVAAALHSSDSLERVGIPAEKAAEIADAANSGDMNGSNSLFVEAYKARTEADKARGLELQQQDAERAKSQQESPYTPTITQEGERWAVSEPDGSSKVYFDSEDAALQNVQDRMAWEQSGHASTVRQLVDWFKNRNDNSYEVSGETKNVKQAMEADPRYAEVLAERMRLAGVQEGDDPAKYKITGEATYEVRDGVYRDVAKIHNGADVMDVVEETAHNQLNRDIRNGLITKEQAAEAAKLWARETGFKLADPENPTGSEIQEAAADMVKAHFTGEVNRKSPLWQSLPSGVRSFLSRMAVYFKEVLGKAKTLDEMRAAGKLSKDWEGYLSRSLGMDEQVNHNRATEKAIRDAVGEIPKPPKEAGSVSYSIGRADYLDSIAKSLDAMPKTPDERLDIAKKARENLARAERFGGEIDRWARLDQNKTERQAKLELDIENRRADLERDIEDLHQRRDEQIAKAGEANTIKFGDRIEAAKTDRERKLLEREAKESAADIKRGIEKDFKRQEQALKERAKADERAMKEKALGADKADQMEAEQSDRRSSMLQALADLDAVLMALPPEVRGKIGGFTKLATLKTDAARAKFFKDRLEKVQNALENHLDKQYSEKFGKLLDRAKPKKGDNKVQKSTLGPEAQEAASYIAEVSKRDADGLAQKVTEIEAAIEKEYDPKKIADLTQQWAFANQFGNFKEKTASEKAAAVESLAAIMKQGRNSWKIQEEARLEAVRTRRDEVLAELKRPFGVTESEIQAGKERDRKALHRLGDWIETNLSFSQTLQELFKNARSKTALYFEDRTRLASNAYTDAMLGHQKQFRRDMKTLFGVKGMLQLHDRLAALQEAKSTGLSMVEGRVTAKERVPVETARKAVDGTAPLDFTREEIKTLKDALAENDAKPEGKRKDFLELERVKNVGTDTPQRMSELEAIQYILSWGQTDVRKRMERQGFTSEFMDGLKGWLSDDGFKTLQWLRERYAEGYDRLNPVYRRMYGMNMPKVENYAPTFYDIADANRNEQKGPMDAGSSQSGMMAGFIKSRQNHNAQIARVDALAAYWRHTVQAEYWTAWAETVREMRGVLGTNDVLRAIRAVDGAGREEAIKKWIKAFETNGQKEAGMLHAVSDFMNKAVAANAGIALGFKIGVLMKQASAMLGSSMELPPGAAAAGWGRFLSGQLEAGLKEVWNSPTIRRRIEAGYSPEVRTVLAAEGITPSRFALLVEKGMYPVGAVDAAFSTISAAIAYDHHYREAIKAGMPEKMAKDYAMDAMDRVIHRTAQPAEAADKSLNEVNASVFGKMLMLFKSEARQKFAISYLAAKRFARGEDRAVNASRLAVTWVLASALTNTMGNIYQTVFTDKENESIWTAGDYARAMLLGHLDGLYAAGPMLSAAATWAMGGGVFPSKGENPLDQIASDMRRKAANPKNWESPEDAFKGLQIYLQLVARTGVVPGVTGAAALTNAIKDAVGATKNATK